MWRTPLLSTNMHQLVLGQEMASMGKSWLVDIPELPCRAAPVGLVERRIFPLLSPAKQSVVAGQDMDHIGVVPSTSTIVHAPAPLVGLVEVSALPALVDR